MEKTPFRRSIDSDTGAHGRPEGSAPNPCELRFSGRHDGLQRLKQWVAKNGALTLTRDEAALIACLEPHHFSKIFYQHVGECFQEWRRRYRIAWALLALADATLSLGEIIHRSGYRDRRAFERSVKLLTGMTPGYIRRGAEGETHLKPHIAHLKPQSVRSSHETIPQADFAIRSAIVARMEPGEGTGIEDIVV